MIDMLNLREVADEWQERIDEMTSSVPNTEGMCWGELADATARFLAAPEQVEYVARYVALCEQLGLTPVEPDTLRWWADHNNGSLIADHDFEDYAREYAEDIGAIGEDMRWPANCIDWERAARELRQDYRSVEYDGDTYWHRS